MRFSLSILVSLISLLTFGNNDKYRLVLTDDPSTTITIGWNQISGSNPKVYYGDVDHGTNWNNYPSSRLPDRVVSFKGMNNHFVKLTGLIANTNYYFVIQDSQGVSSRYWFRTAPSDNSKLSFIAGGDSRNNRSPRQQANTLVSKLKPTAVFFGGDMTNGDSSLEWQEWFDDWQNTIASDGRMFPIIPARGNHEDSNNSIYDLFDVPSTSIYYKITFGANLLSLYTLNSEITAGGNQSSWLSNELASDNSIWKSAQYHKPMRPHVSSKSEGNDEYSNWSDLFSQHSVKLVVECDSHTVKSTWPVVPCSGGSGCEEGFKRDDDLGTVYVGEGCWGAPLRSNDDAKSWTRNTGSFNQFKWIFVDQSKIEIRTVKINNVSNVSEVSNSDPFQIPTNLDIWSPSNGSVVTILLSIGSRPQVELVSPPDGLQLGLGSAVNLQANASDQDGLVANVKFYINDVLVNEDTTSPYNYSWQPVSNGIYHVKAMATDDQGNTRESSVHKVYVGQVDESISVQINSSNDDVEESETDGSMYFDSSDLELVFDSFNNQNNQYVGLLFRGISIPQGVIINNAYIQFAVDEADSESTSLTIKIEDSGIPLDFSSSGYNLSSRVFSSQTVTWQPEEWGVVGESNTNQQTPNLKTLIQQVVDRNDWQIGNNMVFQITGTGTRTAESFDGSSSLAPTLVIEYELSSLDNNSSFITMSSVELFPDQVNDFLYVKSIDGKHRNLEVDIYSVNGELVISKSMDGLVVEFNLGQISQGFYLVKILDLATGVVYYRSFIKK